MSIALSKEFHLDISTMFYFLFKHKYKAKKSTHYNTL